MSRFAPALICESVYVLFVRTTIKLYIYYVEIKLGIMFSVQIEYSVLLGVELSVEIELQSTRNRLPEKAAIAKAFFFKKNRSYLAHPSQQALLFSSIRVSKNHDYFWLLWSG